MAPNGDLGKLFAHDDLATRDGDVPKILTIFARRKIIASASAFHPALSKPVTLK